MLMKCVHIRSATTQHAAEVLSGVPLGAIITTALKRGGKHLALPSVLHKSNPLQSNGPQIQRDGQFVAVVYRRRTSSRKPRWNAATLQYGTGGRPGGKSAYEIRCDDAGRATVGTL